MAAVTHTDTLVVWHFYGRHDECDATAAEESELRAGVSGVHADVLPVAGVCPPEPSKVYRVFSDRADANHRYMTDKACAT